VVGLEARREFDLGELRQRRRATLPVLAGIGGMTVPVVIFLALNPYLLLVAVATVAELLDES
jgi:Na+/H+ antiporter NhaA